MLPSTRSAGVTSGRWPLRMQRTATGIAPPSRSTSGATMASSLLVTWARTHAASVAASRARGVLRGGCCCAPLGGGGSWGAAARTLSATLPTSAGQHGGVLRKEHSGSRWPWWTMREAQQQQEVAWQEWTHPRAAPPAAGSPRESRGCMPTPRSQRGACRDSPCTTLGEQRRRVAAGLTAPRKSRRQCSLRHCG